MLAIPLLLCLPVAVPLAAGGSADPDDALAGTLYAEAMDHGLAYDLLEELIPTSWRAEVDQVARRVARRVARQIAGSAGGGWRLRGWRPGDRLCIRSLLLA